MLPYSRITMNKHILHFDHFPSGSPCFAFISPHAINRKLENVYNQTIFGHWRWLRFHPPRPAEWMALPTHTKGCLHVIQKTCLLLEWIEPRDATVKGAVVTICTGRKWRAQEEVGKAGCNIRRFWKSSSQPGRVGLRRASAVLVYSDKGAEEELCHGRGGTGGAGPLSHQGCVPGKKGSIDLLGGHRHQGNNMASMWEQHMTPYHAPETSPNGSGVRKSAPCAVTQSTQASTTSYLDAALLWHKVA